MKNTISIDDLESILIEDAQSSSINTSEDTLDEFKNEIIESEEAREEARLNKLIYEIENNLEYQLPPRDKTPRYPGMFLRKYFRFGNKPGGVETGDLLAVADQRLKSDFKAFILNILNTSYNRRYSTPLTTPYTSPNAKSKPDDDYQKAKKILNKGKDILLIELCDKYRPRQEWDEELRKLYIQHFKTEPQTLHFKTKLQKNEREEMWLKLRDELDNETKLQFFLSDPTIKKRINEIIKIHKIFKDGKDILLIELCDKYHPQQERLNELDSETRVEFFLSDPAIKKRIDEIIAEDNKKLLKIFDEGGDVTLRRYRKQHAKRPENYEELVELYNKKEEQKKKNKDKGKDKDEIPADAYAIYNSLDIKTRFEFSSSDSLIAKHLNTLLYEREQQLENLFQSFTDKGLKRLCLEYAAKEKNKTTYNKLEQIYYKKYNKNPPSDLITLCTSLDSGIVANFFLADPIIKERAEKLVSENINIFDALADEELINLCDDYVAKNLNRANYERLVELYFLKTKKYPTSKKVVDLCFELDEDTIIDFFFSNPQIAKEIAPLIIAHRKKDLLLTKQDDHEPFLKRVTIELARAMSSNTVIKLAHRLAKPFVGIAYLLRLSNGTQNKIELGIRKLVAYGYMVGRWIKKGNPNKQNREAILEAIANKATGLRGVKVQKQGVAWGTYLDASQPKFPLVSIWHPMAANLVSGEIELGGGNTRDGNYLVRYDSATGQYVSVNNITGLARSLLIALSQDSFDFYGSRVGNKMVTIEELDDNTTEIKFYSVDNSKSYGRKRNRILKTLREDFTFEQPFFNPYSNFSIATDEEYSKLTEGLWFIKKLRTGDDPPPDVMAEYGEEFRNIINSLTKGSDEAIFDEYIARYTNLAKSAEEWFKEKHQLGSEPPRYILQLYGKDFCDTIADIAHNSAEEIFNNNLKKYRNLVKPVEYWFKEKRKTGINPPDYIFKKYGEDFCTAINAIEYNCNKEIFNKAVEEYLNLAKPLEDWFMEKRKTGKNPPEYILEKYGDEFANTINIISQIKDKKELNKWIKRYEKPSKPENSRKHYLYYVKKIKQAKTNAINSDKKLLAIFKKRMELSPSEQNFLHNIEVISADEKEKSIYSPNRMVRLNNIRVTRKGRVAWELTTPRENKNNKYILSTKGSKSNLKKIMERIREHLRFNGYDFELDKDIHQPNSYNIKYNGETTAISTISCTNNTIKIEFDEKYFKNSVAQIKSVPESQGDNPNHTPKIAHSMFDIFSKENTIKLMDYKKDVDINHRLKANQIDINDRIIADKLNKVINNINKFRMDDYEEIKSIKAMQDNEIIKKINDPQITEIKNDKDKLDKLIKRIEAVRAKQEQDTIEEEDKDTIEEGDKDIAKLDDKYIVKLIEWIETFKIRSEIIAIDQMAIKLNEKLEQVYRKAIKNPDIIKNRIKKCFNEIKEIKLHKITPLRHLMEKQEKYDKADADADKILTDLRFINMNNFSDLMVQYNNIIKRLNDLARKNRIIPGINGNYQAYDEREINTKNLAKKLVAIYEEQRRFRATKLSERLTRCQYLIKDKDTSANFILFYLESMNKDNHQFHFWLKNNTSTAFMQGINQLTTLIGQKSGMLNEFKETLLHSHYQRQGLIDFLQKNPDIAMLLEKYEQHFCTATKSYAEYRYKNGQFIKIYEKELLKQAKEALAAFYEVKWQALNGDHKPLNEFILNHPHIMECDEEQLQPFTMRLAKSSSKPVETNNKQASYAKGLLSKVSLFTKITRDNKGQDEESTLTLRNRKDS